MIVVMIQTENILRRQVIKQVARHGIVAWYDPEGHYPAVVGEQACLEGIEVPINKQVVSQEKRKRRQ